jgi:predicted acyltransferase
MVGMAMPFSLAHRKAEGAGFRKLFGHVLWRAFLLVVISNLMSNFGAKNGLRLQLINVLCQISFGYVLCFLILQLKLRWQAVCALALLAGHWGLFVAFPGPDGPFSQTGNIGAVIDVAVLGYNYSGYYTTINFLGNAVTILFGCWAGLLALSTAGHSHRLKVLAGAAAAAFAAGLMLEPVIPMVKRLWTASFTFFSTGWVLLLLIAFYWLVEVRGYRKWIFPFVVFGANSIFIYCFSQVLRGWLHRGLAAFTGNFWFLGPAGEIPQNLLTLSVMWGMCYWLYRRRIFFKI